MNGWGRCGTFGSSASSAGTIRNFRGILAVDRKLVGRQCTVKFCAGASARVSTVLDRRPQQGRVSGSPPDCAVAPPGGLSALETPPTQRHRRGLLSICQELPNVRVRPDHVSALLRVRSHGVANLHHLFADP
jgi:hypothetical protein